MRLCICFLVYLLVCVLTLPAYLFTYSFTRLLLFMKCSLCMYMPVYLFTDLRIRLYYLLLDLFLGS